VKVFWGPNGLARFAVLLGAFVLASGLVVAPQGPVYAATCALVGEGTEANPWQVGSRADFQRVARFDCLASGHYLQTAHLTGDQKLVNYNADRVSVRFTGVYDGDHYQIEFGGDGSGGWADPNTTTAVVGLFSDIGGVVKKVRLTGSIHSHTGTASTSMGTLAQTLDGGLVSEVSSDVRFVKSAGSTRLDFGGLVSSVRTTPSRIEYSSFTGSVEWKPTVVPVTTSLGGIVYRVSSSDFELRDSYASFSGTIVEEASKTTGLRLGGLIDLTDTTGTVRIVRSYASPRVAVTGFGGVTRAGLIRDRGSGPRQFVSVFWQADLAPNAVVTGTAPATYSSGLPVAVALSESQLQTITSYQTKEGPVAGEPGGDELAIAASTGSLAEQDYRWAIEQGNVSVFIPSHYTTASNYLTRELYTDTSVVQTYQTRGVEATATGYPTLGRVWEICPDANGGFPVLVWQEFDCGSSGESSSSSSSTSTSPPTDWSPTQPELAATGATPLALLVGTALIAFGVLARRLASKAEPA
jgi:hypothetical protein